MAARDSSTVSAARRTGDEDGAAILPMVLGLVHDFRSSLTMVLGHAGRLEDGPLLPHQHEPLLQLRQAVEYAISLPDQLLALARHASADTRRIDARTVVLSVEGLVRGRMAPGLKVDYRLPKAPAWFNGNDQKMKRVMINLTLNALEAMPGGALVLGVETVEQVTVLEGPAVVISVQDTGPGIAQEVLDRLFEPLATTRTDRGGSGLGLYIADQLVREHGGRIVCETCRGQGTRFEVVLPAAPAAVSPSTVKPVVLIVERDPDVRGLASTILQLAGWAPRAFANLDEARSCVTPGSGGARAILLEHAACREDNSPALAELLALAPDAGVVLVTHDRNEPSPVEHARLRAVVLKPYGAADLVTAMGVALSPTHSGEQSA